MNYRQRDGLLAKIFFFFYISFCNAFLENYLFCPGYIGKKILKTKKKFRFEQSKEITDLEVAKKMLKIYQSAQDRGLEFGLSFPTVKNLLTYSQCYYTGKKFEEEGPFSRSFDRIDSAKGYIEGNVVSCTVDINSKKSNLSYEEIELIYKKLSCHRNSAEAQAENKDAQSHENTEKIFDQKSESDEKRDLEA